jgi:glycosyltransferase involved in cell wall biosynthesis
MKKISIITPVYNEEENIHDIIQSIKDIMKEYSSLAYEHIFIDNSSTDKTIDFLREACLKDKNLKVIINRRNFGYLRSSYYAIMQCTGDAAILISADLQDPPFLIKDFFYHWLDGKKIVLGNKKSSQEGFVINLVRRIFYKFIKKISETKLTESTIGFGLYDREVINSLKQLIDPYPYFRGLITEIGHEILLVEYSQPIRKKGKSKFNFLSMYDIAITGIVKHSKLPIRIFTISGFILSILSLLVALTYFFLKLVSWYDFSGGIAPILIGMFVIASFQIFFLGLIGEYILSIHTQVRNIPLVFEKERINFN